MAQALHHVLLSLLALSALLFAPGALGGTPLQCPPGLSCQTQAMMQQSQPVAYPGAPAGCNAYPSELLVPTLNTTLNALLAIVGRMIPYAAKYETPYVLRASAYLSTTSWAALSAFHPTALPTTFAPGYGLPFETRISGARNNTINWNTAIAYALRTSMRAWLPEAQASVDEGLVSLGLDPNYTAHTNITGPNADPRDIGIAAGMAVAAFAAHDGWNMAGTVPSCGQPGANEFKYADLGHPFIPINSPFVLSDFTKFQPQMEHNGLGYFTSQSHIAPQFPFVKSMIVSRTLLDTYTVEAPYPMNGKLNSKQLKAYKDQADEVLNISASLTDQQKMRAELFDSKIMSFGLVPFLTYTMQYNLSLMELVRIDMSHTILHDASLAVWREKMKHQAIRPVSAIRYLYPNTNVTAWAGRGQGTQTFLGRYFNSYMRTMPHADWPSATSCICIVWSEWVERALAYKNNGRLGKVSYITSYSKGCSFVEPGMTPAKDIMEVLDSTAEFQQVCTQTRKHAGVHFQGSIDAAVRMCTGLGAAAFENFQKLEAGTSVDLA